MQGAITLSNRMVSGFLLNKMNENLPTRTNNPGDLRDPSTGNFQQFSDPQQGYGALLNDLQSKMTGASSTGLNGNSSLADFANVYAPSSDGNDSAGYAAKLANQLNVSPSTPIGSLEPRIGDFAKAVANNEGYDDNAQVNPQSDPKYQAVSSQNAGMPSWEKWALGGGLALAGGIGALFTGGADLPEVAAGEGALLGGEGAAEAATGAEAATEGAGATEAATQVAKPSLVSKGLSFAKNAAVTEGVTQGVNQVKGLFGGSQQTASAPSDYNDPNVSLGGTTYPQSIGASQTVHNALNEALQQTPSGRAYSQTSTAQNGLQGLSEYGIVPEVVNGSYATPEAEEKANTLIGGLSDSIGQVLQAEGEHANIDDAVGASVENMRKYTPSNEWAEAEQHIKNEADTYRQFADEDGNISLRDMERMKKEQGMAAGKWDTVTTSAKRAAHKGLYSGARQTILKNTKNKDLYEKAMKEEQKLINGKKVLKRLNGKSAKKKDSLAKDVLHHLTQYASIAVGDKIGGPFGAIVGALLGSRMEHMISKRFGQNVLEMKSTKKALDIIGEKNPEVSHMLQATIKKYKLAEEHKKAMEVKRQEYKKKKEGILSPKKETEYEPYSKELPTIKMGKKPKSKGLYKNLPTIKA